MVPRNPADSQSSAPVMPATQAAISAMRPTSPGQPDHKPVPTSPHRGSHPYPSALPLRPSSPRPHSPAASEIFERNVQENALPSELSPAIPSHIQTENYIPPVLEASSLAITDNHLNPDEVEIVTHAAHQPAAVTVAEGVSSGLQSEVSVSPQEPQHEGFPSALPPHVQQESEEASNYGSLDPNDVRRLSFISFADVMQGEHAESGSKESLHHLPLSASSLAHPPAHHSPSHNRSPSPVRSPVSAHSHSFSQEVTTPPTGSVKGVELSPRRSPVTSPSLGSPGLNPQHPQQHGELTIETMRQALRKTGSGDLSVHRSLPASAVGGDEGGPERSPFK